MRPIPSISRTIVRTVRKGASSSSKRPASFVEEATTFADTHTVIADPFTPLPYPQEQLFGYLNDVQKDARNEKNARVSRLKTEKLKSALIFDHIPIERQIVALFPGLDEQYVGMGRRLQDHAPSVQLYERSSEILGYNLWDLCRNGPKSKLDQVIYRQPALFVTSMATLEKLRHEIEDFDERITEAAGLGVGEFCALVVGGILKFEEALKIVMAQANIMHECNQLASSGTITIQVNASSQLDTAIKEARNMAIEKGEMPLCEIAGYLYCGIKTIGASKLCTKFLHENSERFNYKVLKESRFSGASHTGLMRPGESSLIEVVKQMELGTAHINVYSNYSGKVYPRKKGEIRQHIVKQFSNPLKWEQIMQLIYRKNRDLKFPTFCGIGPGKHLGDILYQVSKKAHQQYVDVPC